MSRKSEVARRMGLWSRNQKPFKWTPAQSAHWMANTDLSDWLGGIAPMPQGGAGNWAMSCVEFPLYCAVYDNSLTVAQADTIYGQLVISGWQSPAPLLQRGPWSYLPWLKIRGLGRWAPSSGDLVFFSMAGHPLAHVTTSIGGDRVVSFGEGPPPGALGYRNVTPSIMTIQQVLAFFPGASVTYGEPAW